MRIRPRSALPLVAAWIIMVGLAFVVGRLLEPAPAPKEPPISRHLTLPQVQQRFDLGTDSAGRTAYTKTACGAGVCAWEYLGNGWRVVVFLANDSAPAHKPPPVG